jgi:hypothetical protein
MFPYGSQNNVVNAQRCLYSVIVVNQSWKKNNNQHKVGKILEERKDQLESK